MGSRCQLLVSRVTGHVVFRPDSTLRLPGLSGLAIDGPANSPEPPQTIEKELAGRCEGASSLAALRRRYR